MKTLRFVFLALLSLSIAPRFLPADEAALTIDQGRVGVGLSGVAPSANLHVKGTVKMEGSVIGGLDVSGDIALDGNLNVRDHEILNLKNSAQSNSAVSKGYVDQKFSSVPWTNVVEKPNAEIELRSFYKRGSQEIAIKVASNERLIAIPYSTKLLGIVWAVGGGGRSWNGLECFAPIENNYLKAGGIAGNIDPNGALTVGRENDSYFLSAKYINGELIISTTSSDIDNSQLINAYDSEYMILRKM